MWMAAAAVLPVAVAGAWIPIRGRFPNVDVALALVVAVMVVGAGRRRVAVVMGAVSSAMSFAYFDTQPYERLVMSRQPDVETTIALVAVGLAGGELAVRVARQRLATRKGIGDLSRVRDAATLLATGEELVVVIGAVAAELTFLLGLRDCWFEAEGVPAGAVWVGRDGDLQRPQRGRGRPPQRYPGLRPYPGRWDEVILPVWGHGDVIGRFMMKVTPGVPLVRERLLVAVTLADQVGAALMSQGPPPRRHASHPEPPSPHPNPSPYPAPPAPEPAPPDPAPPTHPRPPAPVPPLRVVH
jgi:hypothetical protein